MPASIEQKFTREDDIDEEEEILFLGSKSLPQ